MTVHWQPDYVDLFAWRQKQILMFRKEPEMIAGAKEYYRTRPIEFINDWVDTYDPRNSGKEGMLTRMPFVMFPRQEQMVEFIIAMLEGEESGLIEKCRDAGATWLCVAVSVWLWLYWDGMAIGWGSRKQDLVDKLGVVDSIFEKLRQVINGLPEEFLPEDFHSQNHMTYMRIINPETGATIVGETGDNIGRGGRTRIYFKDESSHYERPELIEAALGDNTRCQIDISSVNGMGNVFHRKRKYGKEWNGKDVVKGKTNVFVFDWKDHPHKTKEWYEERKAKFTGEGMAHIFAQEVDRNYASSVQGIIIHPDWVEASIDSHIKLGIEPTGRRLAGLDIADGGIDKDALAIRKGILVEYCDAWGSSPDQGVTTRKAVEHCKLGEAIEIMYDCIGVGAGVKTESNRLKNENLLPKGMQFHPWSASGKVQDPEGNLIKGDKQTPKNKDHFANLKAQAWTVVGQRFFKTWQAVTKGVEIDPEDIISLDSRMDNLYTLVEELSQATSILSASTMKVVVDKSPDGTASPNMADALIMCLFPVYTSLYTLENLE